MAGRMRWWGLAAGVGLWLLATAGPVRAQGVGVFLGGGEGDHAHRQAGLAWDTALASERLFNYRMNLGWERFDIDDRFGEREAMRGWRLENSFGFRLAANEAARLWAGPQLSFGIYQGDLGVGAGLGIGGNLHLGEHVSVALTAGGRRMNYSGIFGSSHLETVGYGRLEFFLRQASDRYRPPSAAQR